MVAVDVTLAVMVVVSVTVTRMGIQESLSIDGASKLRIYPLLLE